MRAKNALPLPLFAYRAASWLGSPLISLWLKLRARAGKEPAGRFGERQGRSRLSRPPGALVWLHGISVGESLSLLPMIEALRSRRPDLSILVTSGTSAAAEILATRLPAGVLHQYVPVDTPGSTRRFLDHWQPNLAVFAESEVWPNVILNSRARNIPLALVSARFSAQTLARWRQAPHSFRYLLESFCLLLVRDQVMANALDEIGIATHGLGDLKFGGPALGYDVAQAHRLKAQLAGRRMILAASTHSGEEALLARCFLSASREVKRDALLVIAPRHIGRARQIASEMGQVGLRVSLRSSNPDILGVTDVYIADTLGELGLWYHLADLAILGGSLVDGVGGHNPLEAARLNCPLAVGPYTQAWPVIEALQRCGGLCRVQDAQEVTHLMRIALMESSRLQHLAMAAHDFVAARDNDLDEIVDRLLGLVA